LEAEVERGSDTGKVRALAVFDALDELLRRPDFDRCSLLDRPPAAGEGSGMPDPETGGRLGVSAAALEGYARQAGAANPREAGHQLQILIMGAIVSASAGDEQAARRARALAELLLGASGPSRG
jgi:hypothetical protein